MLHYAARVREMGNTSLADALQDDIIERLDT